ncbi:MAG: endo-1,4-beta-xylanase [Verrucomicrobiota bacterium]
MRYLVLLTAVWCLIGSPSGLEAEPLGQSSDPYYQYLSKQLEEKSLSAEGLFYGLTGSEAAIQEIRFNPAGGRATSKSQDVTEDLPFKKAIHLQVEASENYWGPHYVIVNSQSITKGQWVYYTIWGKCLIGGLDATIKPHLSYHPKGGKKKLEQAWKETFPDKWSQRHFVYKAKRNFAPKELVFQLNAGKLGEWALNQSVLLGGFAGILLPETVAEKQLPKTEYIYDYPGREPEAVWRKEALARIDKIRRGDLDIRVKDSSGVAISGAEIQITLQRHDFNFGVALEPQYVLQEARGSKYTEIQVEKFQEFIKSGMFNTVTTTNVLKWPMWVSRNRAHTIAMLKWLKDNHIDVRGHTMHWGFRGGKVPKRHLSLIKSKDAKMKDVVYDHITEMVDATQDYVFEWDVVNEHDGFHRSTDIFGKEFMIELFEHARNVCGPDVKLAWNESALGSKNAIEWGKYLLEQGAPLDQMGFQGHQSIKSLESPEVLLEKIDRMNELPIGCQITELDVWIEDPENTEQLAMQGDYIRDSLIAFYSHPKVEGIIYWCPVPIKHPIYGTYERALLNPDSSLRPAAEAWKKLVTETWHTKETGKSDESGEFKLRCYTGRYKIVASHRGKVVEKTIDLSKEGESAELVLN